MSYIYAIDYGTSNSLVAGADGRTVFSPVALDPGNSDKTILRSLLYTPARGEWYFGSAAIEKYSESGTDGRFIRSVKRFLPDPGFEATTIHAARMTILDLVAVFLRELRERANQQLERDVDTVILGRPAAFSLDPELDKLAETRLRGAAALAGFKHVELLHEPIAAAFEFRHTLLSEKLCLIADLGGGTSDFTVLRLGKKAFESSDVLAVGGVSIAGDMFDSRIMRSEISPFFGSEVVYKVPLGNVEMTLPKHLINRFCHPADISFLAKRDVMSLLKDVKRWSLSDTDRDKMDNLFAMIEENLGYAVFAAIESAKKELSLAPSAMVSFAHPRFQIEKEISDSVFAASTEEVVAKIMGSMDDTVAAAGVTYRDIDVVCCTGGTAKIPALRGSIAERVGAEKMEQHEHFHSVVRGLAQRAAELAR